MNNEAERLADWLDNSEPNFYPESACRMDTTLATKVAEAAAELRRLSAEVKRLKKERDNYREATIYFLTEDDDD